jgi:dihydrofolate reductase
VISEIFLQISVSLDGYIEDENGDIEWMTGDTSFDRFATATLQSIDGMIFGRKAHELLAQFWPTAGASPDASADLIEQARLINVLPKYVLTHGTERTGWANSRAISTEDVPRLKRKARRPIALFAGVAAAQSLLERNAVDEMRLIRYPILLGAGTRLFKDRGGRRTLALIESTEFSSGATLQRYRFT